MMRWLALLAFFVVTPAFGQADVVASCGSVTIKAGTPHNVTVDLQGRSCRVGGGGGGGPPVVPSSTWSTADATANGMVLSSDGLTVTITPASLHNAWQILRGSASKSAGKLYVELSTPTGMGITFHQGMANGTVDINSYLGASLASFGWNPGNGGGSMFTNGFVTGGFTVAVPSTAPVANDVIGMAVDFTTHKVWVSKNNVWNDSSDPVAETFPIATFDPAATGPLFPAMAFSTSSGAGSWTIHPTAATQKYAPPTGYVPWDGAGTCAEAPAYLARTAGGNEAGNAANITNLICGLVADGVWAKLDTLYVPAQADASDARLNLISANYPLTGTATFTPYHGFAPTSAAGLLTGFNATLASSPHFTQNDASVGVYPYQLVVSNGFEIGNGAGGPVTNQTNIATRYSDGASYFRVNAFDGSGYASPATEGLYTADRSSSTTVFAYFNGTVLGSHPVASLAVYSDVFTIGSAGFNPTSQIIAAAFVGGSLGGAGNLAALQSSSHLHDGDPGE